MDLKDTQLDPGPGESGLGRHSGLQHNTHGGPTVNNVGGGGKRHAESRALRDPRLTSELR